MEFRWIALLALWTILSGPALGPPPLTGERAVSASAKADPAKGEAETSPRRAGSSQDRR